MKLIDNCCITPTSEMRQVFRCKSLIGVYHHRLRIVYGSQESISNAAVPFMLARKITMSIACLCLPKSAANGSVELEIVTSLEKNSIVRVIESELSSLLSEMNALPAGKKDSMFESSCESRLCIDEAFDLHRAELILQHSLLSVLIEDGWMFIDNFFIPIESIKRHKTSRVLITKCSMAVRPIIRVHSITAATADAAELTCEIEFYCRYISGPRIYPGASEDLMEVFVLPSMKKARLHLSTKKNPGPVFGPEMIGALRQYWTGKYGKAYEIDDGCKTVNVNRFVNLHSAPAVLTYPSIFLCTSALTVHPDVVDSSSMKMMDSLSEKIIGHLKNSIFSKPIELAEVYRTPLSNPGHFVFQCSKSIVSFENFERKGKTSGGDAIPVCTSEFVAKMDTTDVEENSCKIQQSKHQQEPLSLKRNAIGVHIKNDSTRNNLQTQIPLKKQSRVVSKSKKPKKSNSHCRPKK